MPTIRPFQFTGLPHWSRDEVALQEGLALFLSYRPFKRKFGKNLGKELETFLKVPVKFSKAEITQVRRQDLDRLVPETTCVLVIGAGPTENKIIVDLDSGVASYCIDRLLGGSGEVGRIQRPLTEIEQGVLSFALLKTLQLFHAGWRNGRELSLTLDRFASKLDEVRELVEPHANFTMVMVRLALGKRVGYARILVPAALITQSFSSPPVQGASTPEEVEYMRGVLQSLGRSDVTGRVEIATLDLNDEDIANIEPGDIIILENHQVSLAPGGVEGKAFVKIGKGQNGGLAGHLLHEGELSKFHIDQIVVQEQPAEGSPAMSDGGAGSPQQDDELAPGPADDNLAETEGLLRDVSAPVVVELGRIKLNTQQVVKLRPGQILRLPRGPNDPVNLVVNGKLFARGELIEVDGELGVRLMQVVGN